MIKIDDKHNCCGCGACSQICPVKCITMQSDDEGFLYPRVDESLCVHCNKCDMVCPIHNSLKSTEIKRSYFAAYSLDSSIRENSSSGGIFSHLCMKVFNEGGIVYGASFDKDWSVYHTSIDSVNDLWKLRGSKYIQSKIGNTFEEVSKFLADGKTVLFSGTPCQIFGLKRFLECRNRGDDNLYTVEIICHGVPSPLVWKDYLLGFTDDINCISYINMRNKSRGWSKYSYLIKSDDKVLLDDFAANSLYLAAYISNYSTRPSCYRCIAKSNKSNADITIADFWGGADKYISDDKGLNLVICNTEKGNVLYSSLENIKSFQVMQDEALMINPSYYYSCTEPKFRMLFWRYYSKYKLNAINKLQNNGLLRKIYNNILRFFYSFNKI